MSATSRCSPCSGSRYRGTRGRAATGWTRRSWAERRSNATSAAGTRTSVGGTATGLTATYWTTSRTRSCLRGGAVSCFCRGRNVSAGLADGTAAGGGRLSGEGACSASGTRGTRCCRAEGAGRSCIRCGGARDGPASGSRYAYSCRCFSLRGSGATGTARPFSCERAGYRDGRPKETWPSGGNATSVLTW